MPVGFNISSLIIIQSLEPHEVQTGDILVEFLRSLIVEYNSPLLVFKYQCENASGFKNLIGEITRQAAASGERPLLHIECHGSPKDGLEFENGSTLKWQECGELFTKLNISTKFNLVIAIAACYGAHLNAEFSGIKPAPAFCIIAPTEEIDPADAMRGFRIFYKNLFVTGDAGLASQALNKIPVGRTGRWFSQLAELWFLELVENYIKIYLCQSGLDRWARSFSRRLRKSGADARVGATRRMLVRHAGESLSEKYFDAFFCTTQVPECTKRFSGTRARVRKLTDEIDMVPKQRI